MSEVEIDIDFSSIVLGVTLSMLMEKYTDKEIIGIMSKKSIEDALAILKKNEQP